MEDSLSYSKCGLHPGKLLQSLTGLYVLLLPIGTGLAGIIGSISLMNYLALLIVLVGLFPLCIHRQIRIKKNTIPTVLYYLFSVISVFWAESPSFNWYVATNLANFIIFIVLNLYQWDDECISKLNKYLALSQIIVIVSVIRNISSLFSYRLNIVIVSTIGISDFACGLCLLSAFWMNIAASPPNTIMKITAYFSAIFNFAVVVMAGSRGAIVMFISMTLIWIVIGNYSTRTKILTIIIIIFVFILFEKVFINYLPRTVTNRLSLSAITETRGSGRFNLWALALEKFKNSNILRMIFGYGFDSFAPVINYGNHGGLRDLMAHNVIFQTLIEGGIIGLALLSNMFFSQFKAVTLSSDGMMKIALVGLFVAALSIDMQVTRIWGFILAYVMMRSNRMKNGKELMK